MGSKPSIFVEETGQVPPIRAEAHAWFGPVISRATVSKLVSGARHLKVRSPKNIHAGCSGLIPVWPTGEVRTAGPLQV